MCLDGEKDNSTFADVLSILFHLLAENYNFKIHYFEKVKFRCSELFYRNSAISKKGYNIWCIAIFNFSESNLLFKVYCYIVERKIIVCYAITDKIHQ